MDRTFFNGQRLADYITKYPFNLQKGAFYQKWRIPNLGMQHTYAIHTSYIRHTCVVYTP